MKINLAILSSDKKSINFVKELNLEKICNLYANCSRNIADAEKFSKEFGFSKFYGSYEDLINDNNVDIVLNFLPSGIKFEYSYLCLKKNIKVVTDYPIINSVDEMKPYEELIDQNLIKNLFLIDNQNFKNLINTYSNNERFSYIKNLDPNFFVNNSLSGADILFELSPDLFFFLNNFRNDQFNIDILDIEKDKITKKINFFNCHISVDSKFRLHILLNNGNNDNKYIDFNNNTFFEFNSSICNKDHLISFIKDKKPFDNLSEFQYYPFKLFQEVLNE